MEELRNNEPDSTVKEKLEVERRAYLGKGGGCVNAGKVPHFLPEIVEVIVAPLLEVLVSEQLDVVFGLNEGLEFKCACRSRFGMFPELRTDGFSHDDTTAFLCYYSELLVEMWSSLLRILLGDRMSSFVFLLPLLRKVLTH